VPAFCRKRERRSRSTTTSCVHDVDAAPWRDEAAVGRIFP